MTSLLIGHGLSSLYNDGLANILGLETLRHGTNPFNYLRIIFSGGDPAHGGKPSGSTGNVNDDTRNFFYLFKDSQCIPTSSLHISIYLRVLELLPGGLARALPLKHSFRSGYYFTYNKFYDKLKIFPVIILSNISGLLSLITPTLRFRFSRIDPERLPNDPEYSGLAYRTTQKVEAWRLGFFGSLITGINRDWFSRAKSNPYKIMTGVAQLTAAVALTCLAIPTIVAAPHLAVIGSLLA